MANKNTTMSSFQRTYPDKGQDVAQRARLRRNGIAEATINKLIENATNARYYRNNKYQVSVTDIPQLNNEDDTMMWPAMFCLSIKRIDKEPIFDWRELQEIKNQVIGTENEGVMLFPAESRLMDTSNQYWMYVLQDVKGRFPFGFTERAVATPEEAAKLNAKQRRF